MGALNMIDTLQWLGCISGVAGSLLLALNTSRSGWGFVLFLVSNVFWIVFAVATNTPGLVAMQLAFTLTSSVGIYRWFFVAPREEKLSNNFLSPGETS